VHSHSFWCENVCNMFYDKGIFNVYASDMPAKWRQTDLLWLLCCRRQLHWWNPKPGPKIFCLDLEQHTIDLTVQDMIRSYKLYLKKEFHFLLYFIHFEYVVAINIRAHCLREDRMKYWNANKFALNPLSGSTLPLTSKIVCH
jgi:hypothetical protein